MPEELLFRLAVAPGCLQQVDLARNRTELVFQSPRFLRIEPIFPRKRLY